MPVEMVRAVPALRRDPLGWLEGAVARWGDRVAFPLPRTPALLVGDPDGARSVLQEHHRHWSKRTVQYGALAAVTGAGLLTSDGEAWRRSRRVAQPAFHHGTLDGVARQSVAAAERVRAGWPARGEGPRVVDVDAATMRATLEVVGRTLFDADLVAGGAGERVVAAVHDALAVVVARARSPLPAPRRLPTPSGRRLAAAVAELDRTCLRVVRDRRRRAAAGDGLGEDLLGLLLAAAEAEGGLDDAQVRDELVTLVIAGHETVASSLTWTLRLLADTPDAQERLAAELAAVLGPPGDARPPSWGDVPALALTRAVVDEGLRLFPPAWVVSRRAEQDTDVAGLPVPAGTLAIVSPWLLGRRAASWDEPLAFRPERFLGDAARAVPRGAYLPFGAGPRLCIGRDFALVESVLALAAVLRDHAVEPVGPAPRVDALVTLRPRGGAPLLVRRR